MNKLRELQSDLYDAQTKVEEAETALMDYLRPIIQAYSGEVKLPGWYHRLDVGSKDVEITLRWDGRGGPYDYDYKIPNEVFSAADPAAEAKRIKDQKEQEKKARQRGYDLSQYLELRKRLGME